jgi:hypothetical protein
MKKMSSTVLKNWSSHDQYLKKFRAQMLILYEQHGVALGALTGHVWLDLTSKADAQNTLHHPR